MEAKKSNIFMELIYSLFNFSYYQKLLHNKAGRVFLHMLILILFTTLLTIVIPIIQFQIIISPLGGVDGIIDSIPYFKMSNDELFIEKPFCVDEKPVHIEIDTNQIFHKVILIHMYLMVITQLYLLIVKNF